MRILKAFTFVAVAGALLAGAAQAQTGTGNITSIWPWSNPANYTSAWTGTGTQYASPYQAAFSGVTQNPVYLLPQPSQYDVFCVDFMHHGQSYLANFSNLADAASVRDFTRQGEAGLTNYRAAAYLASQLGTHPTDYGVISGAIWSVMGWGVRWNSGGTNAMSQAQYQLEALSAASSSAFDAIASQWVVVTDQTARGIKDIEGRTVGGQEFLVHVTATPEPATLLLLGTGLLATLMAAGALRRSAV